MWGSFFASVLTAALFLYMPGFLLLRALRVSRIVGIACAPLAAIPLFSVLTVLYSKAGVFCTWAVLLAPALAVSLVSYAIGMIFSKGKAPALDLPSLPLGKCFRGFDWLGLGLYVALGLVVAVFVYVRGLDGAGSFVQEYDNVHHLGATYGFVLSGDWSPFSTSLYATEEAARINPLPGGGFYPAAWNCVCSFVSSALGVSAPVAANAVNFLFIGVVFPSNVFLLMRLVFRDAPAVVLLGAFTSLAFSAFPWGFLVFGPLYPNMVAFSMVPSAAFCFMSALGEGVSRVSRVVAASVFCAGVLAFAFSQPNAVFTIAVLLAPYCVWRAVSAADFLPVPEHRRQFVRVGCALLAAVAIAVIWVSLYNAPFLHSVVTHDWPAFRAKSQALVDVLLLAFRLPAAQFVLAGLVVAGIVYTLRARRYLWLSCSYVFMCLIYFVAVTSDGPGKFLLAGFWYTDSFRLAASAAVFAVPLAAIGLWLAVRALVWALRRASDLRADRVPFVASCLAAILFMMVNFYPSFSMPSGTNVITAFGSIASRLEWMNSMSVPQVYDADEMAFIDEVKREVPEGALIINEPDDGSAFAYSADGLNLYYRYLREYGGDDETLESRLIRTRLNEVATNVDVRKAVKDVGATYLLVLDQGEPQGERPYLFTYEDGRNWPGIESVNDATPGFEAVLSRGDMRLYRIVATG